MMNWFYALMVVGVVGGIMLEAYLEKRSKRKEATMLCAPNTDEWLEPTSDLLEVGE